MTTSYSEQVLAELMATATPKLNDHLLQLALTHDGADLLYSLAHELRPLGYHAAALQILEQLLTDYPQEDDLRCTLAECYIDSDQTSQALAVLTDIATTSEQYPAALLLKADCYQVEGYSEAAQAQLHKAEALLPDHPAVLLALAESYFVSQSYQAAARYYRKLLVQGHLTYNGIAIVGRIAVAYAQSGAYDHAIGYFEQLPSDHLTDDQHFQLAVVYAEVGRDDDAKKHLEMLLDSDPSYTTAYPVLGNVYERLQDYDRARRTYQLGFAYDETNAALYRQAGQMSEYLGDNVTAQSEYAQAVLLDDDDAAAVNGLLRVLLAQQAYDDVVTRVTALIAAETLDPHFDWYLAQAYRGLLMHDEADRYYAAAANELQHEADFLKDSASWYHEQGQRAAEYQSLTAYLALVPDDIDAQWQRDECYDSK